MTDLSLTARVERLAKYLQSISSGQSTENVIDEMQLFAESIGSSQRSAQKAGNLIRKAVAGEELSADDVVRAEAIVHKTKRPSHLITNGWFDDFRNEFAYLTEDEAVAARIRYAIPAIGRIDLPRHPLKYGGTGFVVGKNLVVTNRHVAELFATGVGLDGVQIKPWQPGEVDFKKEFGTQSTGFPLTKCLMIHPFWDMALFVADLPDEIVPLRLATTPTSDLLQRDVVVIGYPALDPERNDPQVQQEVFEGKYNVKRIAPGQIALRKKPISSAWLKVAVDALAHDSSTLGGNSGSAVVDVATGLINGLHFAGRYLVENYAVPGFELARDPRVVDAGIQFHGEMPESNADLDRYWSDADSESFAPTISQPRRKPTMPSSKTASRFQVASADNHIEFEVPLRITVSLNTATTQAQRVSQTEADISSAADAEAPALGFDTGFLSEAVAVPGLSAAQTSDAFEFGGSTLLHYTHFSVCLSKSRKLPRYVAWNIDGAALKSVSRKGIPFISDPRVPDEFQAGDELYKNNPYDRGHIARRADLTWGSLAEAKRANKDSFFFTNITPQHESFNQSSKHGLWGELENAIMADVDVADLRVSVIGGPIFRNNDPKHRNVKIPRDFWKLVAFHDSDDDQFKVAAYVLTQSELIPTEALELDPFKLYQVTLPKLASETGLSFDELAPFDTMDSTRESLDGSGVREIKNRDFIV